MMHLQHAPHGGARGVNGHFYKGGEFLPFYVPRELMPQVKPEDYDELRAFLSRRGVGCVSATVEPATVRAHQRIDVSRALTMPEAVYHIPALVSSDRYVLDGNHRWLAHVTRHDLLPALIVGAEFERAIDLLLAFPKTTIDHKNLGGLQS
jgi:hypothetical protein